MVFIRISEAIAFLSEIIYLMIWIRSEGGNAQFRFNNEWFIIRTMCTRFCLIIFFFFFSFLRTWVKRLEFYSLMCSMVHRWKLNPELDTQIQNYGEKYFFSQVYFRSINFAKILFGYSCRLWYGRQIFRANKI